jgi:glycosyltransferase involved in cell wall biosynthesis
MHRFKSTEHSDKPKVIVISAVNLTEGGGLTVLKDSLASVAKLASGNWKVVALVHDKRLVEQPEIELIEMPLSKRSWLSHLYHEWYVFKRLSKNLKPDLWLSLHDVTPIVQTRRQAVYWHNPAPFYKMTWREVLLSPTFWIFTHVYKYLYNLFVKRNTYVIVQQEWLRSAFFGMFGKLPIVVAYPHLSLSDLTIVEPNKPSVFLSPAVPRFFKNFEVICEAAKVLESRNVFGFEIRITLNGTENTYAKWLYKVFKDVKSIQFIGLQSRDELAKQYQASSAVIFPSKLETWGLPISEAKLYNKPLLLVDLPYAHETVGNYNQVGFFSPTDAVALADLMEAIITNNWQPDSHTHSEPMHPFARNWDELWAMLIKDL